ncbi:MAG: ATP synthase F1 subunit epsilon [Magnetococcales bacterium]|nr:ATP synthase F1 subunit epsilon [Magnetococcales bacterium]
MSIVVQLEIVTPEALLLSEETDLVTAPGAEGYFGVMAGHAPFVTLLQAGVLTVGSHTGEEDEKARRYAIAGGYAEILPGKVTILTERAMAREELRRPQVDQERKEAREKLSSLTPADPQGVYWQSRLDFADVCQALLDKQKS